jgi:hypothetical protein
MMINVGIRIGGLSKIGGFDGDAAAYFERAGVTDATAKSQINTFVVGVKALGLYNNMVSWPLRSAQNAGTGTTAYSLGGLGTFNGTLTNGPTWGADGVDFDGTNDHILTGNSFNTAKVIYVSYKNRGSTLAAVCGNYNFNGTNETGYELLHNGSNSPEMRFYTTTNNGRLSSVNCNDGNFHFAMGITDNTASQISVDGTTGTFTNLTNPPRLDSTLNFAIGSRPFLSNIPINAIISFVAIMDLYTTQFDSVRTLYKTTMGTGLGLP